MTPPLMTLRAVLVVLFGAGPVQRFVDPVLGDVHDEHARTTDPRAQRAARRRGAWLVLQTIPALLPRVKGGSFGALVSPLVLLATLGIVAMAREPGVARLAAMQSAWLVLGVSAAAAFALAAHRGGARVARAGLAAGTVLVAIAASPFAAVEGAAIHVTWPLALSPLKLVWPFVVIAALVGGHVERRAAAWLVLAIATTASARGAIVDACFAWTAVAATLAHRRGSLSAIAPLGLAIAIAVGAPPASPIADPHTDGILDTIFRHGGFLGLSLAGLFSAWAVVSWRRVRGPHAHVARAFGIAFAAVVALSIAARLGGLPVEAASVAGLGYGGSSLWMLFGTAGVVAGATAAGCSARRSRESSA